MDQGLDWSSEFASAFPQSPPSLYLFVATSCFRIFPLLSCFRIFPLLSCFRIFPLLSCTTRPVSTPAPEPHLGGHSIDPLFGGPWTTSRSDAACASDEEAGTWRAFSTTSTVILSGYLYILVLRPLQSLCVNSCNYPSKCTKGQHTKWQCRQYTSTLLPWALILEGEMRQFKTQILLAK